MVHGLDSPDHTVCCQSRLLFARENRLSKHSTNVTDFYSRRYCCGRDPSTRVDLRTRPKEQGLPGDTQNSTSVGGFHSKTSSEAKKCCHAPDCCSHTRPSFVPRYSRARAASDENKLRLGLPLIGVASQAPSDGVGAAAAVRLYG